MFNANLKIKTKKKNKKNQNLLILFFCFYNSSNSLGVGSLCLDVFLKSSHFFMCGFLHSSSSFFLLMELVSLSLLKRWKAVKLISDLLILFVDVKSYNEGAQITRVIIPAVLIPNTTILCGPV